MFLAVVFHIMIEISDWDQIAMESQERQMNELALMRKLSAASKNRKN